MQATRPNEILALDFTQLEPASDGRENVLILTDIFTKYSQAISTKDVRDTKEPHNSIPSARERPV